MLLPAPFDRSAAHAEALDRQDPLRGFRASFYMPTGAIYLDGNSLGLLSVQAEAAVYAILDAWKTQGVGGWTDAEPAWFTLAERLAGMMAPLVGADPDEVVVTNSTTVNLHQLLATLFDPAAGRTVILADALGFPSDLYALRSHLRLRGLDPARSLRLVASVDGLTLQEDDIIAAMTEEIGLIVLPSVLYVSGQLLDMERLTQAAHARGIPIGFDCSHSAGAIPHQLRAWEVDFAFWCGYKYLNGGPGCAGSLYLNRRRFDRAPGLAGWFGSRKDRQFAMAGTLEPAHGAGALQIGTPNILSMAPLLGTLPVIAEAGIDRIRAKSLALTTYLMALIEAELKEFGIAVVNPEETHRRGGHVAIRHRDAAELCAALQAAGVVPDFRPPNIIRLAPAPLYTSFWDCREAIDRLKTILACRV